MHVMECTEREEDEKQDMNLHGNTCETMFLKKTAVKRETPVG